MRHLDRAARPPRRQDPARRGVEAARWRRGGDASEGRARVPAELLAADVCVRGGVRLRAALQQRRPVAAREHVHLPRQLLPARRHQGCVRGQEQQGGNHCWPRYGHPVHHLGGRVAAARWAGGPHRRPCSPGARIVGCAHRCAPVARPRRARRLRHRLHVRAAHLPGCRVLHLRGRPVAVGAVPGEASPDGLCVRRHDGAAERRPRPLPAARCGYQLVLQLVGGGRVHVLPARWSGCHLGPRPQLR
mmetsp:Transcript_26949/g.93538  ORF Transcript_26949/g.93538 Transcript_26949/m.93538 type:complete len:246 (-) Transcript_26949:333-1070(-)